MAPLRCWSKLKPLWGDKTVENYGYQVEAAERVVYELDGRAILADEVGLGKTIEAGLVMRELLELERVSSILVLTPASLVIQWFRELREKFDLDFCRTPSGRQWKNEPRLMVSIDLAKREPQASQLRQRSFDLVVVDEAHVLKNHNTLNHQLVRSLNSRHLLLLSATPLQNDLIELYNLVNLVRPGLLGTRDQFKRRYLVDKRTPRDAERLKSHLSRVMIRNNREQTDLIFPERQVALLPIELSDGEQRLYNELTDVLREAYWNTTNGRRNLLPLLMMQREVCSSPHALAETLANVDDSTLGAGRRFLHDLARHVDESSKAATLEALVLTLGEKVLVFTEFLATQRYLAQRLRRAGLKTTVFHGGLTAEEKDAAQQEFRDHTQVLVSTECGGQGLNLQFCHNVVNFDLPWNPMRVEQRIGRVHRLGQNRRVRIYNLFARDTIEEYIIRLLDQKINLFREVVGDLDIIIRQLERARSFESTLLNIALTSRDEEDMRERFEQLGRQLEGARQAVRTGGRFEWVGALGRQQSKFWDAEEPWAGIRATGEK